MNYHRGFINYINVDNLEGDFMYIYCILNEKKKLYTKYFKVYLRVVSCNRNTSNFEKLEFFCFCVQSINYNNNINKL